MLPRVETNTNRSSGANTGSKLCTNSPLSVKGSPSSVVGMALIVGSSAHLSPSTRYTWNGVVADLRAANAILLPSQDTAGRRTSLLAGVRPHTADRLVS